MIVLHRTGPNCFNVVENLSYDTGACDQNADRFYAVLCLDGSRLCRPVINDGPRFRHDACPLSKRTKRAC